MAQCSKTTPNEKPVDISKCRVRRIGSHIDVCMVNTPCIFADEHPLNLKLCGHPLRNHILGVDTPPQAVDL